MDQFDANTTQIISYINDGKSYDDICDSLNIDSNDLSQILVNLIAIHANAKDILLNNIKLLYPMKSKSNQPNVTMKLSLEQQHFIELIKEGNNIFLTGPPGVGKSFCLKYAIKYLMSLYNNDKDIVGVTAMTGCAATIINGNTIHSYLKIGLAKQSSEELYNRIKTSKRDKPKYVALMSKLKVLIIDEVSMMNKVFFVKISNYLKKIKDCDKPFGGVQIILSGDFCQLPPVENIGYIFESKEWLNCAFEICYLTKSFRQSNDLEFQQILNEIRFGDISDECYNKLLKLNNFKHLENGDIQNENIKPTKMFPINRQVDSFNEANLIKLVKLSNHEIKRYAVEPITSKPITQYLSMNNIPEFIDVAIGAQIMVTFNINTDDGLINGTLGTITDVQDNTITILTKNNKIYNIGFITFTDPDDPNIESPRGLFNYMPIKLAYATSIHKSQGQTLDLAEIDLAASFGFGMGYVAISRCKNLQSLVLLGLSKNAFQCDPKVKQFYDNIN